MNSPYSAPAEHLGTLTALGCAEQLLFPPVHCGEERGKVKISAYFLTCTAAHSASWVCIGTATKATLLRAASTLGADTGTELPSCFRIQLHRYNCY